MNFNVKIPEKKLYIILILCGLIIFINSMDVMIKVKDIELYNQWVLKLKETGDLNSVDGGLHDLYVTSHLSFFLIKIIVPMVLGIYSYFAFKYNKINKIYVYIWTIFLLGSLAFNLVELRLDSIFYYVNIVSYIILIITILSLLSIINSRKNS
ncbi:hypothetical protein [Dethiothermospora halolimnae]|uniref:hypothetical protein n=1 Tax=Dethiothermospora halolimnae TaxID=3114390 RepID=UPI003CCB9F45